MAVHEVAAAGGLGEEPVVAEDGEVGGVKAPLVGLPKVRTMGWYPIRSDSQSPLLTAPGPMSTAMGLS